jgi:hypothetical protein
VWQLRRNKLQQAAMEQKQASMKKVVAASPTPAPAPSPAGATTASDAAMPSVTASAAANGCRNNAEGGK